MRTTRRNWWVPAILLMLAVGLGTVDAGVNPSQDGVFWGVFQEGLQGDLLGIDALTDQLGKKPATIMWYIDWTMDFPEQTCRNLYEKGILPHIVWEAWRFGDVNAIRHKNVLNGEYDNYLARFGKMAGKYGKPVVIRWGHEMNGNWYPWSGAMNGNSYESYIKTYRYVHDKVVQAGGANIIWAWSPNCESFPGELWNQALKYYPGDAYVDWIAVDGYNWGTSQPYTSWKSFNEIFGSIYRSLVKHHPSKPIMIGEFGCSSKGGNKAKWINAFFKTVKEKYPNVRGWIWFNINKETDWRYDSDAESLAAFKAGLSDPMILSDGVKMAELTGTYQSAAAPERTSDKALQSYKSLQVKGDITPKLTASQDIPDLVVDQYEELMANGVNLSGKDDLVGRAKIVWNAQGLALMLDIIDDKPMINIQRDGDLWNGDCVEICLGLDPSQPSDRGAFAQGDFQLGINYAAASPYVWNWTENKKVDGAKIIVLEKRANGTKVFVKIPWGSLRYKYTPKVGDKIRFDIAFDDADKDTRDLQMIWAGNSDFYKEPMQWGLLELVE